MKPIIKRLLQATLFPTMASVLLIISPTGRVLSQSVILPPSTLILHYRLPVTYNSTTVLVFPAIVRPVDRGDRDILAQRQPGVDNVLKLKAARRNFPSTNLHVFTADGRIYAFDLFYTDSLASTYDLTRLESPSHGPEILLMVGQLNSEIMNSYISAIRAQAPDFSVVNHRYHMQLRLECIDMGGPLLFFRFTVTNHSTLDYTPDFMRLYIRDQARAKRTSHQEQEITPIYSDSLVNVPGKHSRTYVIAIPRVTIPDRKEFRVELFERSGGRSLSLRIQNRQLFRARHLATPNDDKNGNP